MFRKAFVALAQNCCFVKHSLILPLVSNIGVPSRDSGPQTIWNQSTRNRKWLPVQSSNGHDLLRAVVGVLQFRQTRISLHHSNFYFTQSTDNHHRRRRKLHCAIERHLQQSIHQWLSFRHPGPCRCIRLHFFTSLSPCTMVVGVGSLCTMDEQDRPTCIDVQSVAYLRQKRFDLLHLIGHRRNAIFVHVHHTSFQKHNPHSSHPPIWSSAATHCNYNGWQPKVWERNVRRCWSWSRRRWSDVE